MAFAGQKLCSGPINSFRMNINRIDQTVSLNPFITILKESAYELACESEDRLRSGSKKSLIDGCTIAVKDNFCTKDVKTTCASKMLANFIPPYDCTVVKKLKDAGAIIIGKTNLDEFAMGSGTVDSLFGPTRNVYGSPFQKNDILNHPEIENFNDWRIAGGSSGGSAVAVACGSVFAAIGSDTGGSTRNPASYCGVIGFKPSYGIISRYGLIPLVNSMDVPGILASTVDDVADIYNVISGPDHLDSTTINEQLTPATTTDKFDIKTICVGIPKEYHHEAMSTQVKDTWKQVANLLQESGAKVKEVSMPYTASSIVTYTILNSCEVASNMCRYSGLLFGHRNQSEISTDHLISETRKEGFGAVVRSRILTGNYFLLKQNYEKYFLKAMKVRRLIANDFMNVWSSGVHLLLTPTTLTTAPLMSDFTKLDNRAQCSIQDYCTQPANMAGCPAVSLPVRLSAKGLPISLQLIGRNFDDALLLRASKWLESAVHFQKLKL